MTLNNYCLVVINNNKNSWNNGVDNKNRGAPTLVDR